jgi:hypothetical protein
MVFSLRYQAGQREYHRASELEQRHHNNQPRFAFRSVNLADNAEGWDQKIEGNGTVIFEHYGGRVPENIRFDPVRSSGGRFSRRFTELAFASCALSPELNLDFEVWIIGAQPKADMELFKRVDKAAMLERFVADRSKGLPVCSYLLTVRYMDRGEKRTKRFEIEFNPRRYLFTVRVHIGAAA